MDPTRIALFDLAEKRLNWTAQRQNVLAANIANVNTPGYQARDITAFDKVLDGAVAVAPVQTQPGHMAGTLSSSAAALTRDQVSTRSLDRNGVTLDEQLVKVADTETTQNLVTNIWKSYMGMFSTALGKGA
ncbi:MAG: flagellar basal body rod protein FlgB [Rhodopila sp.]